MTYLRVSEIVPIETRAMAIALFYLVGTGEFGRVAWATTRASLMIAAGVAEWLAGVDAENRQLENLAASLSAAQRAT